MKRRSSNTPPTQCELGRHRWDHETGRCVRCHAALEHPDQSFMFGYDPTIEAEKQARERATGQRELYSGDEPKKRKRQRNPLLALVSGNPPQQNPLRVAGPSITFAPFSPWSKVSLDLLGVGYEPRKRNPGGDTVALNVATGELRRYPNPPEAAVERAWLQDHHATGVHPPRLPVQAAGGFVRAGPWLARGGRRRNVKQAGGRSWAYLTLELIFQAAHPPLREQQPRVQPPAVRFTRHDFERIYAAMREAPGPESAARAYERWKQETRTAALERPDAYDFEHSSDRWFALDVLGAFDTAWAILGTPHPLDQLAGFAWGHASGEGYDRERELLLMAATQADEATLPEYTAELERIAKWQAEDDPDLAGKRYVSSMGRRARERAVEPGLEARRRALRAPPPAPLIETEVPDWRRAREEWQAARAEAIRRGLPVPPPPARPFDPAPFSPTPEFVPGERVGKRGRRATREHPPIVPGTLRGMLHELVQQGGGVAAVSKRLGVGAGAVSTWLHGGYWRGSKWAPVSPGANYDRKIRELYSEIVSHVPAQVENWQAVAREIVERTGGPVHAARLIGVTYHGLRGIMAGAPPIKATREKLSRALRHVRAQGQIPVSNPRAQAELAWLTNPERQRRRNRDSKWKQVPDHQDLEAAEFKSHPDWQRGQKLSRRFHGKEADKARVYEIDDGKDEVTVDPNLYVALHETLEVPYVVPWDSTKRGDDPKNPIIWFHEFPAKSRPMKLLNVRTGITSDVGGSYVVDDYWYS